MSWWIILPIGIVAGMIYSVSNTEQAQTIVNAIMPVLTKLGEIATEIIRGIIQNA